MARGSKGLGASQRGLPGTPPLVGAGAARGAADPRTRRADGTLVGVPVVRPPLFVDRYGRITVALGDGLGEDAGNVAVLVAEPLALEAGSPFSLVLQIGEGLELDELGALQLLADTSIVQAGRSTLADAMDVEASRTTQVERSSELADLVDRVRALGTRSFAQERTGERFARSEPVIAGRFR